MLAAHVGGIRWTPRSHFESDATGATLPVVFSSSVLSFLSVQSLDFRHSIICMDVIMIEVCEYRKDNFANIALPPKSRVCDTTYMSVQLKKLRLEKRWTQKVVAKHFFGDSDRHPDISKMETGTRQITADEIEKFCTIFSVTPNEFLGVGDSGPEDYNLLKRIIIATLEHEGPLSFEQIAAAAVHVYATRDQSDYSLERFDDLIEFQKQSA